MFHREPVELTGYCNVFANTYQTVIPAHFSQELSGREKPLMLGGVSLPVGKTEAYLKSKQVWQRACFFLENSQGKYPQTEINLIFNKINAYLHEAMVQPRGGAAPNHSGAACPASGGTLCASSESNPLLSSQEPTEQTFPAAFGD